MVAQRQPMTAEELEQVRDNAHRHELVRGELRTLPFRSTMRGEVSMRLLASLGTHVEAQRLGAVHAAGTGFLLARQPDTVRAPDGAFIHAKRLAEQPCIGYWPGAPDLAVEVVEPADPYDAVMDMLADWLAAGTCMVLIVDPRRRSVTVYRSLTDFRYLTDADTISGEDVVPGWELPVADLFPAKRPAE